MARTSYLNRMDLLSNATVVSEAVRLINIHTLSMIEKAKQDNKNKNNTIVADASDIITELEENNSKECIDSAARETAEQLQSEQGIF